MQKLRVELAGLKREQEFVSSQVTTSVLLYVCDGSLGVTLGPKKYHLCRLFQDMHDLDSGIHQSTLFSILNQLLDSVR